MTCKYNETFCVQVKNKPCMKYTTVMRLISWIHTRGSETDISNVLTMKIIKCKNTECM
jgi:hypothetical protein